MKTIPKHSEHGNSPLVCVVARYEDGSERVLTGAEVAHVNWEAEAIKLRRKAEIERLKAESIAWMQAHDKVWEIVKMYQSQHVEECACSGCKAVRVIEEAEEEET